MIIEFISPFNPMEIQEPMVTKMVWETHRKGKAGSLKISLVKTEGLSCILGTYVRVREGTNILLQYRIYERVVHSTSIQVVAYDQLYTWVKSKESMLINPPGEDFLHRYSSKIVFPFDKQSYDHYQYIHYISDSGHTYQNGIFPSDLILQFAIKYNLLLDKVYYGDCGSVTLPIKLGASWQMLQKSTVSEFGHPSRVTNQECVLDIIQSYINQAMVSTNRLYIL